MLFSGINDPRTRMDGTYYFPSTEMRSTAIGWQTALPDKISEKGKGLPIKKPARSYALSWG